MKIELVEADRPDDNAPRKKRSPPTDVESMAACLLGEAMGWSYGHAMSCIRDAPEMYVQYLRLAQMAIDHMPYLEVLRAERADALRMWLGADADA